jgi:hypothetical protein
MKMQNYLDNFIASKNLKICIDSTDLNILIDFLIKHYSKKKHLTSLHQMSKCIDLLRYIIENYADVSEQKELFEKGDTYIRDDFDNIYLSKSQCICVF